eukprot:6176429-Pleurochrysis_carterae.AAC.4
MNDWNCEYGYEHYLCSTNRWDVGPPPSPPSPPTSPPPPPLAPPPPISPHAGSCTDNCERMGYCEDSYQHIKINGESVEVYCVFDGTTGIDTVYIQDGLRTSTHTDPNSCPPGMDIWVPRTHTILNSVRNKYGWKAEFVGIYGTNQGAPPKEKNCGGCQNFPLHSGSDEQAAFWTSVGPSTGAPAEPWFVRAVKDGEPNGDYTDGCWCASRRAPPLTLAMAAAVASILSLVPDASLAAAETFFDLTTLWRPSSVT